MKKFIIEIWLPILLSAFSFLMLEASGNDYDPKKNLAQEKIIRIDKFDLDKKFTSLPAWLNSTDHKEKNPPNLILDTFNIKTLTSPYVLVAKIGSNEDTKFILRSIETNTQIAVPPSQKFDGTLQIIASANQYKIQDQKNNIYWPLQNTPTQIKAIYINEGSGNYPIKLGDEFTINKRTLKVLGIKSEEITVSDGSETFMINLNSPDED